MVMDLTQRQSRVIRKQHVTPTIVELTLQLPEDAVFSFAAGQYIQFLFEYTFRSYSIVNSPQVKNSELTFCIKLVPEGLAAAYVENLRIGDEVLFRGPYGEFCMNATTENIVCVAAGVGIAPIRSIISEALTRNVGYKISLLFGVRKEADIFYFDHFYDLAKRFNHFSFIPTLSQAADSWLGERGRVTDYIQKHPEFALGATVFICGSQAMVIDSKDLLLRQGVRPGSIKMEIFS